MWQEMTKSFLESLQRTAVSVAAVLPEALAMLLIVLVSMVLAWLVRRLLSRFLSRLDFDRRAVSLGLSTGEWVAPHTPTHAAARLSSWTVLAVGFLLGLDALSSELARKLSRTLLGYLPNVVIAGLILLGGLAAARFVERAILIGAVNKQIHSARFLALGAKWLVLVLCTAMGLDHLGVGGEILTIAFGALFGGIVLALSLAFGLGSRDVVRESWERQRARDEAKVEVDDAHHL